MATETTTAAFAPIASTVNPSLWTELARQKLEILKLDARPLALTASYTHERTVRDRQTGADIGLGSLLSFDASSFTESSSSSSTERTVVARGSILNYNTQEDFKNADKPALFEEHIQRLHARFAAGPDDHLTAADLNPFLLIAYADLKKFRFVHWFAFPALIANPPWTVSGAAWAVARDELGADGLSAIETAYARHALAAPLEAACCLARLVPGQDVTTARIGDHATFFADVPASERLLVFLDSTLNPSAAGWQLRNILAFLAIRFGVSSIRVLCLRATSDTSRVVTLKLPGPESYAKAAGSGWERNQAGKLGPRVADLGPMMDPQRLADQAVDLNLKLMRWRILPTLDLEKIKRTKCLLLGAGTLGCFVSRTLLAWGVHKITLVDSATVSYSNPVRQPLFEFKDCLDGGRPKAEAAAEALKRIYPGVDATGLRLSIPMPGHPVPPSLVDSTRSDVATLEKLIDEHDVVYLLMDSRESRWLPTLLGAAKSKLVMNAALGFDTYLVMRHGVPETAAPAAPSSSSSPIEPARLGCYFCADIVAPVDSLADRTLDQMCTVTRPGLAALAGATAVELMVSVIQHPRGAAALSDVPVATSNHQSSAPTQQAEPESPMGYVPHQIRGALARFETLKLSGRAYDRCTACSEAIVAAYRSRGFDMLLEAFEDGKALERMTGLDKLHDESEAAMEAVDWDEEDDEAGM